jgi:hypothetical protein
VGKPFVPGIGLMSLSTSIAALRRVHSPLRFAPLIIGHHFSISAF